MLLGYTPDYHLRRAAATAVWLVEGASTETLNDLAAPVKGLKLPGELRPEEEETLARALRKAETDPGTFAHRNVILDLGPKATAAVPVLRKRLALLANDHRNLDLESELLSLGLIGPAARLAAGEIEKYLGSQESDIRVAAAIALAHVQQDSRALPILREDFSPWSLGQEVPLAILYLAPEDEAARRKLDVPLGEPLLLALTKRAIREPNAFIDRELLAILLREQKNTPRSPK